MASIEVGEAGWRNEAFQEDAKGKNFVFFYEKQVQNQAKTLAAGRPIFDTRVMIKKLVPGDPRLVIDTFARPKDYDEFPQEYARFQNKRENRPTGTPIEAWPILSDTQKAEFRALNIFTVEQFANLPDSAGERIMGLIDLRKKARAFILAQEAGDKLVKMEEEAAKAKAKDEAQEREIAMLKAQMAELMARKKPGRPKKVQVEQAA